MLHHSFEIVCFCSDKSINFTTN